MKKVKCGNPLCNKMFDRSKIRSTKYCSPSCSYYGRLIRQGNVKVIDDFKEGRKGYRKLPNGLEVRNDAMGKEITDTYSSSHWANYK